MFLIKSYFRYSTTKKFSNSNIVYMLTLFYIKKKLNFILIIVKLINKTQIIKKKSISNCP